MLSNITGTSERFRDRTKDFRANVRLKPIIDALSSFWLRGTRVERAGYVVGVLLVTSGVLHLGVLTLSGRSWEGPLSLRKPTTFGLSFGLTLITIVWVAAFLEVGKRLRALLLSVFTVACALETTLVSLQAWRGVPSHFNIETRFDAGVARALAAGGVMLVVTISVLTVIAFRANGKTPISLRVAIRTGFITLLAAQITGAMMIARGMMLVFRGNAQAAYAHGGMLKPTHAVTMHGVVVLPLLAWALSFTSWSERRRLTVVLVATGAYVGLAGTVAAANEAALSPLQLPPMMAVSLALGLLLMAAAGGLTVLGVICSPSPNGIKHG